MTRSCYGNFDFVFFVMIEEMETQTWNLYRYVANKKFFLYTFLRGKPFFCQSLNIFNIMLEIRLRLNIFLNFYLFIFFNCLFY